MKNESIQSYSKRITQANPTELVVITYEIILEHLDCAWEAAEQNEMDKFQASINGAINFLKELIVGLDFQYEIAAQLMSIYLYVNKELLNARRANKPDGIPGIKKVLIPLFTAFQEVSRQDQSEPVMQNTHKVYAGLTYNRGDLSETYINADQSRGFRA
ncbi:flagellar export chaperone FliS [Anaeromicropila populeti]|uniref:Flagellar protein FliS n=1 Tax=Anaeromicropila populeti TaxID=37658 RepID=A0A1I6LDC4_9FIRM|nr:flagellar protein FliS [Anaeromicropila populeti]SFS01278.1 flagellar protein FliS [Anaeromicropila populeti]